MKTKLNLMKIKSSLINIQLPNIHSSVNNQPMIIYFRCIYYIAMPMLRLTMTESDNIHLKATSLFNARQIVA